MKEVKLVDSPNANYDSIIGNYEDLEEGLDDVLIIKNYPMQKLYVVKPDDTIKSIIENGYIINTKKVEAYEMLVLNKDNVIRHVVKPTENIYTIANKYNESIENIIKLNNLSTNRLYIGQMLVIKEHL